MEYKLLDWVDVDLLNWELLSRNPLAIRLLEQNPDKINWKDLSSNVNAIHIIEERIIFELID
jgi:hypothetical protein